MKLRDFIFFVAPSVSAMVFLIALPLLGSLYLALHTSHTKTELTTVTTKVPLFGGLTREETRYVPQPVLDEHGKTIKVWKYVGLDKLSEAADIAGLKTAIARERERVSLPELISGMYDEITNYDFWGALEFTLLYTFVTTPFVLLFGFLLALSVNRAFECLRGTLIFATLLPMIVAPVVSSLSVYWLFIDNAVISSLLELLGFGKLYFLKDEFTIRTIIILYGIWYATPFAFIILYAGLKTVPGDTLDAARVDGANRFQATWYVTVPHLAPLFGVITVFHVMDAYRVFEPILVFGSSVFANSLQYLTYFVLAFQDNIHRAAAYGILTLIGVMILLVPVLRMTWKEQKELAG